MTLNLLLHREVKMTLKNAVLPIILTALSSFLSNNKTKTQKLYQQTKAQILNLQVKKNHLKAVLFTIKNNIFNKKINFLKIIITAKKILNLNKTLLEKKLITKANY